MLWYLVVFLTILWFFGFIGHIGGNVIHLVLVIALVLLVVQLITGRRGD
jgi:hypothetical protein